jgi:hypothetical protein
MSENIVERQIADIPWCDVELRGIAWVENGRDLVLSLRLPPSEPEARRERLLRASWVRSFCMDLSFAETSGGCPVTWDVTIERTMPNEWSVRFDFGRVGELSFRCVELELTATL